MKYAPLLAVALGALIGCAQQAPSTTSGASGETSQAVQPTPAPPMSAEAMLRDANGSVVGTVTFTQEGDSVRIDAMLNGVARTGLHGIHIHEAGECVPPDFTSAGGHFAPAGHPHGCPPAAERHAGDLGNIEVSQDGTGSLTEVTDRITLGTGDTSVIGRSVILHEGEDDCTSQPSGDAGARIACGQIVMPTGSARPETPASSPNNPQS